MKTLTEYDLAGEWYGSAEALQKEVAQCDDDLFVEIDRLAEPTFGEFVDAKSAAHDVLWAEAKRRGIVS
jgi:hypothetical protein